MLTSGISLHHFIVINVLGTHTLMQFLIYTSPWRYIIQASDLFNGSVHYLAITSSYIIITLIQETDTLPTQQLGPKSILLYEHWPLDQFIRPCLSNVFTCPRTVMVGTLGQGSGEKIEKTQVGFRGYKGDKG